MSRPNLFSPCATENCRHQELPTPDLVHFTVARGAGFNVDRCLLAIKPSYSLQLYLCVDTNVTSVVGES